MGEQYACSARSLPSRIRFTILSMALPPDSVPRAYDLPHSAPRLLEGRGFRAVEVFAILAIKISCRATIGGTRNEKPFHQLSTYFPIYGR